MTEVYIVAGFPGTGKSSAGKVLNKIDAYNLLNAYDLESSDYHWVKHIDSNKRVPNLDWPMNYVDEIIHLYESEKDDLNSHNKYARKLSYIFISTHKEVLDELDKRDVHYTIVAPERLDSTYIDTRYKSRGSSPEFIDKIKSNFDIYINDIMSHEKALKIFTNVSMINLILNPYHGSQYNAIVSYFKNNNTIKDNDIIVHEEYVNTITNVVIFYTDKQEEEVDRIIGRDSRCIKVLMPDVDNPGDFKKGVEYLDKYYSRLDGIYDDTQHSNSISLFILSKILDVYQECDNYFFFVKDYPDNYMTNKAINNDYSFLYFYDADDNRTSTLKIGGYNYYNIYHNEDDNSDATIRIDHLINDINFAMYITYCNNNCNSFFINEENKDRYKTFDYTKLQDQDQFMKDKKNNR